MLHPLTELDEKCPIPTLWQQKYLRNICLCTKSECIGRSWVRGSSMLGSPEVSIPPAPTSPQQHLCFFTFPLFFPLF